MKMHRGGVSGVSLTIALGGVLCIARSSTAQINSWTNATSGNWEDPYWSLGVLPGTNQDIMLTNEGWKAVAIDPNTAQNFPQTLTVDSITISSPSNSYNTLLLNYSGIDTPLTAQAISVGSNSAMTMLSSALQLDGPSGVGLQVGGEFNQTDSLVGGQQVNVGYIGPGVYTMNSGILDVSNLWVGGSFDGVFNQTGGTNDTAIVGLDPGGTYNFSGGDFNATVYFNGSSTFHQTGGSINQPLTIFQGTYLFDGGFNYGGVVNPIDSGPGLDDGSALVIQTGGTNFGPVSVGAYGSGTYILSNGCSFLPSLNIGRGTFQQVGGTQILTNGLSLATAGAINYEWGRTVPGSTYALNGGTLMTSNMAVNYIYYQNGGTNIVTGGIQITNLAADIFGGLELDGGLLQADNITTTFGGIVQLTGGCLMVNNLTAYGDFEGMTPNGPDIQLLGGELDVSNIDVELDNLGISGTLIKQTGILTLYGSWLWPGPGVSTFGPLNATTADIVLPANVPCQIHFGDSSSQPMQLIIRNWSGSLYGGGSQQIIFGSNSAALTAGQVSQIQFYYPAGTPPHPPDGLPSVVYLARMLPTGEVVPDIGAPLLQVGSALSNGAMPLTIEGDIGQNYELDVSTDLVNWSSWTTVSNSTGTIFLSDSAAANFPQRFYRVRVLP